MKYIVNGFLLLGSFLLVSLLPNSQHSDEPKEQSPRSPITIELVPYGSKDTDLGMCIFLSPQGRISRVPGRTIRDSELPEYIKKYGPVKEAARDQVHILIKDESTPPSKMTAVLRIIEESADRKRKMIVYVHLPNLKVRDAEKPPK